MAAIALLGRVSSQKTDDLALLQSLLAPRSSPSLQAAAIKALGRSRDVPRTDPLQFEIEILTAAEKIVDARWYARRVFGFRTSAVRLNDSEAAFVSPTAAVGASPR